MKVALLNETKPPLDRRVALVPEQVAATKLQFPKHVFIVQTSQSRAFPDSEYKNVGIEIQDDITDCDLLIGIKEVELISILPEKTYLIFSHTAKEQAHNQNLLKRFSELKCTLIDYEYLVRGQERVVAFGYWAGIVGAYNALNGYGIATNSYNLKPATACKDLAELKKELKKVKLKNPLRVIITGEGRVASGAIEILTVAGIERITPEEFLSINQIGTCYCQVGPQYYTKHKNNKVFEFDYFNQHPDEYETNFQAFFKVADMLIASHFWDNRSPQFYTLEDLQDPDFKIRFISDISCDIPGPIPTTIRATTSNSPFYGIEIKTGGETDPFILDQITVTAVDNLPSSLPRDSSFDFGESILKFVMPDLLSNKKSDLIEKATILNKGKLTERFKYLNNFLTR